MSADRTAALCEGPSETPAGPRSVLLVTRRWTRDGGVSTHVQASAEILARHGIDVRVLCARVESDESIPGVTIYRSPELFDGDVPVAARIGEGLAFAPEIVHFHQVDLPELVQAARQRAATIVSAHVYTACSAGVYYFRPGHECTRGHGPGCIPNLALRGCAHLRDPRPLPARYRRAGRQLEALMSADLVVSYSSAVDRHLAANRLERRRMVPYTTTIAAQEGSGHETRRRVVYAGRVVREKGVDVLIRAAREIEAEFVICGDGMGLEAMRKLARRCHVERRVEFKGWLAPDELSREVANASVVAIPSLWPEPFGMVGIEALAAGRPVVASATGGIEDWLEDGVSGLCVKPGDVHALAQALNELLSDPERQHAMGMAGRRTVSERFSAGRHLDAILEAYQTALASSMNQRSALNSSPR